MSALNCTSPAPPNRREALRQLLCAGAAVALAPPLLSCVSGRPPTGAARPKQGFGVDDSFARWALASLEGESPALRARLLAHPALAAMLRHQRLAGNSELTSEALLDRTLEATRRARPTSRVLDAWAHRENELAQYVNAAALYLPAGVEFTGSVYFVMGYDLGVAAPPDIVLNVAHEHFEAAPSEVGPYATHEAHHVGFLASRPPPELKELNDAERLRGVIRYMTQLEGMGVHAAYPLRVSRGSLGADGDYRIYTDVAEAHRVTARYAALTAMLSRSRHLTDQEVGTILDAMSSGERVWYRFGALVSWTLERSRGRKALVESIGNPSLFESTAADLLKPAGVPPHG